MDIQCHRCGEVITAPYFHEGKPYGYSCIKVVNPTVKKNKHKEHWVKADTHNYINAGRKCFVTAIAAGVTRKSFVVYDLITGNPIALDTHHMRVSGTDIFINLL